MQCIYLIFKLKTIISKYRKLHITTILWFIIEFSNFNYYTTLAIELTILLHKLHLKLFIK